MGLAPVTALVAETTPAPRLRCSRLADAAMFREALSRRPVRKTEHFGLHVLPKAQAFESTRWLIGAVVPKRAARRAVTRNAVRRRIYVAADHCLQTWIANTPSDGVASEARPVVEPRGLHLVVRLIRGWSADELRSASHAHWREQVSTELARLFDSANWAARA
jgi:ribonuclease P protein component